MTKGSIDLSNRQIKIKTDDGREIIIEKQWWRLKSADRTELRPFEYGKFERYLAIFKKLEVAINSGVKFDRECDRTRVRYYPSTKHLSVYNMFLDEDIYLD